MHNIYRRTHNAPDMQLSPQLSKEAQLYAEKLARLHMLVHDKNAMEMKDEGENVGVHCSSHKNTASIKKVLRAW